MRKYRYAIAEFILQTGHVGRIRCVGGYPCDQEIKSNWVLRRKSRSLPERIRDNASPVNRFGSRRGEANDSVSQNGCSQSTEFGNTRSGIDQEKVRTELFQNVRLKVQNRLKEAPRRGPPFARDITLRAWCGTV